MPEREERRAQAAKHLALMKGAFSTETEATVAAARVYEDGEGRELPIPEAVFETTETSVTTAFAPAAVIAVKMIEQGAVLGHQRQFGRGGSGVVHATRRRLRGRLVRAGTDPVLGKQPLPYSLRAEKRVP